MSGNLFLFIPYIPPISQGFLRTGHLIFRHRPCSTGRCRKNKCLDTNTLGHRRTITSLHNNHHLKVCNRQFNYPSKSHSMDKKSDLRHLHSNVTGDYITTPLNAVCSDVRTYFFFSSSTVGAESLYLKRLIFCVAVFSKGSFITSTELTCDDLFTFLLVTLSIFAFQWSSFS